MGVAFVGKGMGVVGVPTSIVTPAVYIAATYRILAETGSLLVTEALNYLRAENG